MGGDYTFPEGSVPSFITSIYENSNINRIVIRFDLSDCSFILERKVKSGQWYTPHRKEEIILTTQNSRYSHYKIDKHFFVSYLNQWKELEKLEVYSVPEFQKETYRIVFEGVTIPATSRYLSVLAKNRITALHILDIENERILCCAGDEKGNVQIIVVNSERGIVVSLQEKKITSSPISSLICLDQSTCVIGAENGDIYIVDLELLETKKHFSCGTRMITSLSLCEDNPNILVGCAGEGKKVFKIDIQIGRLQEIELQAIGNNTIQSFVSRENGKNLDIFTLMSTGEIIKLDGMKIKENLLYSNLNKGVFSDLIFAPRGEKTPEEKKTVPALPMIKKIGK